MDIISIPSPPAFSGVNMSGIFNEAVLTISPNEPGYVSEKFESRLLVSM